MKLLKKYASLFAFAALAFGTAACSDDDGYKVAEPVSEDCQEVYFPSSNPAEALISPAEVGEFTLNVKVRRNLAYEAASIPVKVLEGTSDVFVIPETIEFAEGEAETSIAIGLNPDTEGGEYALSIGFEGDLYLDPYKIFEGHVLYSYVLTIESWENLGMAQITEDMLTSTFGSPNVTWACECWTRSTMPGYICLKNAYTSTFPLNDPGDYQEEDHWFYVNISDPEKVYFPAQYMGFSWNPAYGEFLFGTLADGEGKLENGVITFPAKGIAFGMRIYTEGKLGFYGNQNGRFKIVLPE